MEPTDIQKAIYPLMFLCSCGKAIAKTRVICPHCSAKNPKVYKVPVAVFDCALLHRQEKEKQERQRQGHHMSFYDNIACW